MVRFKSILQHRQNSSNTSCVTETGGSRAGLDSEKKKIIFPPLSGIKPVFLNLPARRLVCIQKPTRVSNSCRRYTVFQRILLVRVEVRNLNLRPGIGQAVWKAIIEAHLSGKGACSSKRYCPPTTLQVLNTLNTHCPGNLTSYRILQDSSNLASVLWCWK